MSSNEDDGFAGFALATYPRRLDAYFVLDSGATEHLCGDPAALYDLRDCPPITLTTANGSEVRSTQSGTVCLRGNDTDRILQVSNVYYRPHLPINLLSLAKLQDDGIQVVFGRDGCELVDMMDGSHLGHAVRIGSLWCLSMIPEQDIPPYLLVTTRSGAGKSRSAEAVTTQPLSEPNLTESHVEYPDLPPLDETTRTRIDTDTNESVPLDLPTPESNQAVTQATTTPDAAPAEQHDETSAGSTNVSSAADLWHCRLGHVHWRRLLGLSRLNLPGFPNVLKRRKQVGETCRTCALSKSTARPSDGAFETNVKLGTVWHLDTIGPMGTTGIYGARYIVHLTEMSERLKVSFPVAKKSDARKVILHLLRLVPAKLGTRVTTIHCDNAPEFSSLRSELSAYGVEMTFGAVNAHNTNAVVERANLTHANVLRALLHDASLDAHWWPYASAQASFILNRVVTRTTGRIPLWAVPGSLDLHHIKRWGCRCYVHVPSSNRSKLSSTSVEGVFLGNMPHGQFRVYIPSQHLITVTRDVKFDESVFPTIGRPRVRPKQVVAAADGLALAMMSALAPAHAPVLAEGANTTSAEIPASNEACYDHIDPATVKVPRTLREARRTTGMDALAPRGPR